MTFRNFRPPRAQNLPGIKVADHADRGKQFEDDLCALHHFYLERGICDVVQNPNAWEFAQKQHYWKYKKIFEERGRHAAQTGDGRYLMRVRSAVDFSGGNATFSICFDAKQTEQKNFPLEKVSPEQVKRLKMSDRCGTIAGLMVWFVEPDRVFFVPSAYLTERYEKWEKLSFGKRRAPPGTASLSIADLEANGREIFKDINKYWDWFTILIANRSK